MSNETIEDFIGKVFNLIEQEDKELGELEEKRKEIKNRTRNDVVQSVVELWPKLGNDGNLQRWVIAYLYWNVPKITVGTIEQLFGLKSVIPIAKEFQIHGLKCSRCKGVVACTSRSDYASASSWSDKKCDKCRAEERAVHDEHWKKSQQEREARLNLLKTMPYKDYLQTDEWQSTRIYMLKRAGFRCQLCNKQGTLNVHHRTYERRGHEDAKDLIVLCGTCHAKFHDKIPAQ